MHKENSLRFSYSRGSGAFPSNEGQQQRQQHTILENNNLPPYPPIPNNTSTSDYSVFSFGNGSITSVAASTIVDGAYHAIAHWKVLIFGQLLSFFLASAGAASEELNGTCQVSVPLTQTGIVMFLLMILGGLKMRGWCAGCCRKKWKVEMIQEEEEDESFCSGNEDEQQKLHQRVGTSSSNLDKNHNIDIDDDFTMDNHGRSPFSLASARSKQPRSFCWGLQTIHAPLWLYFLVGLVGVEAYYLIFLSFRYTSFTFIYLVMALAIPSAMLFSKCLLGRSYRFTHILGGLVCISGILINTFSDLEGDKSESKDDMERHIEGDIAAISGAILLGLEDVLSELMIKQYGGLDELFFMKGFFGLWISVAQLLIFERDSLVGLFSNFGNEPCALSTRLLLLSVYVIFQFMNMSGETHFLSISEAALLNLSLLTSDLWATVFSIFEEGFIPGELDEIMFSKCQSSSGRHHVSLFFYCNNLKEHCTTCHSCSFWQVLFCMRLDRVPLDMVLPRISNLLTEGGLVPLITLQISMGGWKTGMWK